MNKNKINIDEIPDDNIPIHYADGSPVTWCMFCGSKIGQTSKRNNEVVTAMYYCDRCSRNYCDQCSYADGKSGGKNQKCLRCESVLEQIPI
jgi:hypothetical protein